MSTQRRVVRWQRPQSTELTGSWMRSSNDDQLQGPSQIFRRIAYDSTALKTLARPVQLRTAELATNSLSFGSRCTGPIGHRLKGSNEQHDAASPVGRSGLSSSFQARTVAWAGILSEQLPSISPSLQALQSRNSDSARTMQSALPQVPTGVCPGTERQYGQGNLYLQHASRDAAGNFGRRSAR
jgi:hypothetical protein